MNKVFVAILGLLATACGAASNQAGQSHVAAIKQEKRVEFTVEIKIDANSRQCLQALSQVAGKKHVDPFEISGHTFATVMIAGSHSSQLSLLPCVESVFEVVPRDPRPVGSVGNQ